MAVRCVGDAFWRPPRSHLQAFCTHSGIKAFRYVQTPVTQGLSQPIILQFPYNHIERELQKGNNSSVSFHGSLLSISPGSCMVPYIPTMSQTPPIMRKGPRNSRSVIRGFLLCFEAETFEALCGPLEGCVARYWSGGPTQTGNKSKIEKHKLAQCPLERGTKHNFLHVICFGLAISEKNSPLH